MMKTLMTHGLAFAGAAAMMVALIAAGAPEAESPRSGVGNDRTGMTTDNWGMMTDANTKYLLPNDDIGPILGSTSPETHNVYGTTEKPAPNEIYFGG